MHSLLGQEELLLISVLVYSYQAPFSVMDPKNGIRRGDEVSHARYEVCLSAYEVFLRNMKQDLRSYECVCLFANKQARTNHMAEPYFICEAYFMRDAAFTASALHICASKYFMASALQILTVCGTGNPCCLLQSAQWRLRPTALFQPLNCSSRQAWSFRGSKVESQCQSLEISSRSFHTPVARPAR